MVRNKEVKKCLLCDEWYCLQCTELSDDRNLSDYCSDECADKDRAMRY